MPTLRRHASFVIALLACTVLALAESRLVGEELDRGPAVRSSDSQEFAAKRDRLWQEAEAFAAKENWAEALRSGRAAFEVQNKHFAEQPLVICRMLSSLSFWHTKEREFPLALAAARELLERRRQLFVEDYWQTVDARLNVAFVERLAKLTADEWQQLLTADQLHAEAVALQRAGKNAAALENAEKALPIYANLLGPDNSLTLTCRSNVVICHLELGQYFQAEPHLKELIDLQPQLKGKFHPDTILSLTLFARFNEAVGGLADAEVGLSKVVDIQSALSGPNHPDTIAARVDLGRLYSDEQKFAEAEELLVPALEQQRKLFGDEHLATAQTMKVLGALRCEQRKYDDAEKLLAKSVEVFSKLAGEDHLATASAYNALGKLHTISNQLKQADEDFWRSITICVNKLGDQHPATAKVLDNMARLSELDANKGKARQIRLISLHIAEQTYGQMNVRTADALENVAIAYISMNDIAIAELYLLRAREIRRKLLGEDDPKTARIVGHLAYVCLVNGDFAEAESLFNDALTVIEKTEGPDSAEAGGIRGQLGLLYRLTDRLEESETEYRRALKIYSNCHGPDHYLTAVVKGSLVQTVLARGDCQEACRLIDETLEVYHRTLKYNEPKWFDALGIGARAHLAAGNTEKATELLKRGLHIAQVSMELAGAYESERQRLQQITGMREMLDLYLSLPSSSSAAAYNAHGHILVWKGAIATRQWLDRQYVSEDTAPLVTELQQLCRRWATLQLRVPDAAERNEWTSEINKLKLRKDALEQQLADYRSRLQTPQEQVRTADLVKTLSPSTALIDILQYTHTSFEKEDGKVRKRSRERYVAFVLHRYRDLQRIDLGDVEPIAEAVANWRKTRGFRPNQGKTDWAAKLGELLWPPLKPYLNDCDTLLISPDGVLSQLSWNALPGRKPDTYLIEDFAIGMVPVPQLLVGIHKPEQRTISFGVGLPVVAIGNLPLEERRRQQPDAKQGESLLLIGDIDYEAAAADNVSEEDSPSKPSRGRFNFGPLKGTAAEVQALGDRFKQRFSDGELTLLDKSRATEEAFWREAPRHRWLHIATHGFFAPSSIKSALAAQSPGDSGVQGRKSILRFNVGFLNGLALTGANSGATTDGDDGILTAMELSVMDLSNVDVAVLSGCETGLGEVEQGEGSFGMQRALQIAGVGATVGSLWTVSDEKTNLLMQRFYTNLWDKKLSKLEALREAQLWLLRTGGDENAPAPKRLSPHYWAAFTLSGDWR